MAFEKVYSYGTPKSGVPLENVLLEEFEWDFSNEDITPMSITKKYPKSSNDVFKITTFDEELDEWVLTDNPFQKFIHKYLSQMTQDNTNPATIKNSGTTTFDSLKYNPLDYRDEWVIEGVDNAKDRDTSNSRVLLGVSCNQVWSDDENGFIFAEPFTDDVRSFKKQDMNSKCSELLTTMDSDVLGSIHTYDFTTQDRQNLTDAIEYLKTTGDASVNYRCGEMIDGVLVKSNKPHTLSQLEQLNTQFQKYKIDLLNACDLLKRKCDELTDKEDIYYLEYADAQSILDGSFIPYTQRPDYVVPDWRAKTRDIPDYEIKYYKILKREGLSS